MNGSDEVERYQAALDHPPAPQVIERRNGILASNDRNTERIKWNAPGFYFNWDDRVTFRLPPRGGFQLVFHRGARVKDITAFQFEDDSGLLKRAAPGRAVATPLDAEEMRARQADLIAVIDRWMIART